VTWRARARVRRGKRRGAEGDLDGAFTLDRGGRRDGQRQRQLRPTTFSGDGGVPVLGGRREVVEGHHGDVALLETLVGSGEQPRRRQARQWSAAAQGWQRGLGHAGARTALL
jgi:hypothetical protein